MKTILARADCCLAATFALASAKASSNPPAEVYFVNLSGRDTVTPPGTVEFGPNGIGVAPAGTRRENTGHYHLHFGGGQTEAVLQLAAGARALQPVLGNSGHLSHATPIVSEVVTISVG